MKKTITAFTLFALFQFAFLSGKAQDFSVTKDEISNGYIIKKVWLQQYTIPEIHLSNTVYKDNAVLPEEALPANPQAYDIVLGKERKRPFALVRIPAYAAEGQSIKQLSGFTLNVTEKVAAAPAAAKTTAASSPLATGNWYKIAVGGTGLYKIDYDFVAAKMGLTGTINSANIRVFGNGGNMLPEDNSVARKDNLEETAIWVNDGGDGVFNAGDYLVFYATGSTAWAVDPATNQFRHTKNLYEDKGYYFLNFDQGHGKRIGSQASTPGANVTVNSYNDYALHEQDITSPLRYGKRWWGEDFGTSAGKNSSRDFEIDLGTLSGDAIYRAALGSRSSSNTSLFTITQNGAVTGTYALPAISADDYGSPMTTETANWKLSGSSGKQKITITYQPGVSDALGYLDYIEVNTRKVLSIEGQGITFRDLVSVAPGNIAAYQLANAGSNTMVWDVTDAWTPVQVTGNVNGNIYIFSQNSATLHQFAAANGSDLPLPEYIGPVANQNLHGEDFTDYIIVSYPDFLPAANALADFHRQRSGMRVLVVTPEKIYNEFSSGGQDISAIRDFAKMFYDRAGNDSTQMPKYILLFGDASYDYRNRVSNNTNFVPTFESAESLNNLGNFCGDDFFAFLDDNESIEKTGIANTLDIGIGRLPVKNLEEADNVVNKIKHYKSPASLGPWRLSATIVADNEDGAGPHMEDGELMTGVVERNSDIYNANKIYEDAIPMISTPGGARAPEANKMINDQIFKGTLLLNYNGHGNTEVLSHERIITQDDWNKWKNLDKLPFSVTATCDFGQFDQPQFVSAGEQIVLKKDGGVISAVTTVKLVYQSPNRVVNMDYLNAQFQHVNGRWNTFGDAFRIGKNQTYSKASTSSSDIVNFRKFALLGDPALEPDFPEFFIYNESLIEGATGLVTDTVSALGEYTVNGYVGDVNSNILSNFNGRFNIAIYDKPRTLKTITNINKTFMVRNNIIYKGKATVTNGKFSVKFIAPKDINYDFGKGKMSYYAENGITDAAGSTNRYTVGGFSDYPVIESNPPVVRPYIEDSLFRNGGLTGPNTLLFGILEDETGINVSGNSVGHDLMGIMDGDVQNPFILNDYYETEANTYKRGYINFPLDNIAEGRHRLVVKAWDNNNNSGEGTVDFEVANGNIMKVQKLMNYPNPFHDITHFVFEHNHPDEFLYAEINIYNTAGALVRTIKDNFYPGSSRSNEITWDGTDNNGAKIASGMYLYRMSVTNDKGFQDSGYQKLVFIR